ncbi:membrane protein [Sphingomonas bisphenolicum]|uniref:Membrane protein n=2 Tax=Sphingomonadaceae TaxID=41297 RepID=A0ABN5W8H8_9SPHN|nr:membrane protein [Sphingomonas bisphenolicum]
MIARAASAAEERAMDLLGWIVVGLLAGAIARLIMPGRDPGGCVVTILLGIAGALLAGFVGRLAGFYATGERAGFVAAIVGAIAVLALYRFFAARR